MSVVDIVIAVHDPSRAIERAVDSVLRNDIDARAIVVAHNIDPAVIRSRLSGRENVSVIACADGIASPSGPFNAGLDAATAEFIGVLGSDDELEAGALDAWVARARRDGADAVLARIRHASGARILTPPVRPGRRRRLDPVADRLAYRSAPLGILRRERFADLRFPPGLRTGEDLAFTLVTWFTGGAISLADAVPAYLVHDDAVERVTTVARPMTVDTASVDVLLDAAEEIGLTERARTSIGVKLLRQNLTSWVLLRPNTADWDAADDDALHACARRITDFAPHARPLLSQHDARVLDAALDGDGHRAATLAIGRSRPSAATLLTTRLRDSLRRDAPLRFAIATVLLRFGR